MGAAADPRRDEALAHFSSGKRIYEVAHEMGVPRSTVQNWHDHWKRQPQLELTEAKKDMEIAALRSKLKQAEQLGQGACASFASAQHQRPVVTPAYAAPASSSPEARWKAAELENAEHIKKSLLMAEFSVELPDDVCAITFVSDQHISLGNTVDLERMRLDAECIAAHEGVFAVLGGDATDNHIKHRAAVLAARSQPSDQFELFEWYLSIFAHRVLVAISGNHDLWTNQMAGVDVMSMLLKKQQVYYAPDEALLNLKVGPQPYRIGMRHQFRMNSSMNQTHSTKQWMRFGDYKMDIGCIGHHHVGAIEPFYLQGDECWSCRPGSYQINSAYSRQYGYGSTRPTCPTFVLFPDRRHIVGFHRLEDGLVYLKAVRGK